MMEAPNDRVVVLNMFTDICTMQVCAEQDATDEEILEVCNRRNPSGTQNGWSRVERNNLERPDRNPVKCKDFGRIHYLVTC